MKRPFRVTLSQLREISQSPSYKVLAHSWFNVLLLCIPAGIALNYLSTNNVAIFVVNFLAVPPCVRMSAVAADDLVKHTGGLFGAIVFTTFSNIAQLVTSILLLSHKQIVILQLSLIGAIISNVLLTNGIALLFGGISRVEQFFNVNAFPLAMTLHWITGLALVVIAAFKHSTPVDHGFTPSVARAAAVLLILLYFAYICTVFGRRGRQWNQRLEEDEDSEPTLTISSTIVILVITTALITINTEFATGSIAELLVPTGAASPYFIGLVVIPVLSSDPTPIVLAWEDKVDLLFYSTIGKTLQISLFIMPIMELVSWGMNLTTGTLRLGELELFILLMSLILGVKTVERGKSHWLTGMISFSFFIIIAVASYFYPDTIQGY